MTKALGASELRPLIYSQGIRGYARSSKLLTRSQVVDEFKKEHCTFGKHSVVVRREDGAEWEAPKGVSYRVTVYDFTGFQLPGDNRVLVKIDSENPEIVDRVRELLDGPISPLPIDDQGHLHYVSVEILARDRDPHKVRTGWSFIPEGEYPMTTEAYLWVAAVTNRDDTSPARTYTSLTEAGMWRSIRMGESIRKDPNDTTTDVQWLWAHGRRITHGRQAVAP